MTMHAESTGNQKTNKERRCKWKYLESLSVIDDQPRPRLDLLYSAIVEFVLKLLDLRRQQDSQVLRGCFGCS